MHSPLIQNVQPVLKTPLGSSRSIKEKQLGTLISTNKAANTISAQFQLLKKNTMKPSLCPSLSSVSCKSNKCEPELRKLQVRLTFCWSLKVFFWCFVWWARLASCLWDASLCDCPLFNVLWAANPLRCSFCHSFMCQLLFSTSSATNRWDKG